MLLQLPIVGFLSIPLLLWPLSMQVRAGNIAVVTLSIALLLVNLIRGINAVRSTQPYLLQIPKYLIDHLGRQRHSESSHLVRYQ